jgi:hypothetical protein
MKGLIENQPVNIDDSHSSNLQYKSQLRDGLYITKDKPVLSIVRDPLSEYSQHMYIYLEFIRTNQDGKNERANWKFDLVTDDVDSKSSRVRMSVGNGCGLTSLLYTLQQKIQNHCRLRTKEKKLQNWRKRDWQFYLKLKNHIINCQKNKKIIYSLSNEVKKKFNFSNKFEELRVAFSKLKTFFTTNIKVQNNGIKNISAIIESLTGLYKSSLFVDNLKKLIQVNTQQNNWQEKLNNNLNVFFDGQANFAFLQQLSKINNWELTYYFDKLKSKYFENDILRSMYNNPKFADKLKFLFEKLQLQLNKQNNVDAIVVKENKELENSDKLSSSSMHINMQQAKKLFAYVLEQRINPPEYNNLLKSQTWDKQPKQGNCASFVLKALKIIGVEVPRKHYSFLGYIVPSKLLPIKNLWYGFKRKISNVLYKISGWFTELFTKRSSTNYRLPDKDRDGYSFMLKYASRRLKKYVNSRRHFFGLFSSMSKDRVKQLYLLRKKVNKITRRKDISYIEKYKLLFVEINRIIQATLTKDKELSRSYHSRLRNALQDIKYKMLRRCEDAIFKDLIKNEIQLLYKQYQFKNERGKMLAELQKLFTAYRKMKNNLSAVEKLTNIEIMLREFKQQIPNSYRNICRCLARIKKTQTKEQSKPESEEERGVNFINFDKDNKVAKSDDSSNSCEIIEITSPKKKL